VKAKAFTAILSILLLTGITAGIQVQPEKAAQMESNNIEIGEREQVSTLDRIFQSLNFLSVIDAPENANPGSTIEFTSEVDVQETFNLEGSVNVVEIYKCQDSSCDDGELVEANSTFNEFDFVVEEGTSHTWTTRYTQRVCDEQNPMAVHKTFQLDAGEVSTTTLQVDNIDESGSYDVFLLTRDACFPDNEKVDPYFNSIRAGTIDFESGEGVVGDVNNNLVLLGILGLFIVVIGGVIWAVN